MYTADLRPYSLAAGTPESSASPREVEDVGADVRSVKLELHSDGILVLSDVGGTT